MTTHAWRFFRAGGVDQVQVTTGADLLRLGELDQKLWVALACPTQGIEFDRRTLELIDADGDRRVRANELIAACAWAGRMLKDPEQLARRGSDVPLAAINTDDPEGKVLHDTMRALLRSLGKPDAASLDFADIKEAIERFNAEPWNGDGVVPVASAPDDEHRAVLTDILACTAEPPVDRGGEPGVDEAVATAFFDAAAARVAWLDAGTADAVRALGEDTEPAFAAYDAVAAKVDDYFARVRVAAYDTRALDAINREESEYLAIAAQDLHITAEEVRHFPLARVTGDQPLPLKEGVNPAWSDELDALRRLVVVPLVGDRDVLTAAEWTKIRAALQPHADWRSGRNGDLVASLDEARLRELATDTWRERVQALVERDLEEKALAEAIGQVERLVRYNRDLMHLANNFVSFRDFYSRRGPSTFQVGRLYLDRRSCDLCVDVTDNARHVAMAGSSNAYLVYCDLKNSKGETRKVVAAVTDGDVDNIMVGRNGLFYDRDGLDWDATITRVVENPISVRQAFWSPYKRILRAIEAQVNRRAQEAEDRANARADAAASQVDSATDGNVPAAQPPAEAAPRKLDIGVVAAIGVAVGGLTAALGMLLQAFFGLGWLMPLGVLGLILLISGPSMAIAWLKLRTRNLGPLLDANGWAVNAMARVNVPLGKSLTEVAELPKGAERDLADPFADKKKPWFVYFIILVLLSLALGWYIGKLDRLLPTRLQSVNVLGDAAPARVTMPGDEATEADGEGEQADPEAPGE